MKGVPAANDHSEVQGPSSSIATSSNSFISLMSTPLAGRISFQTFTNLLPSSWSASPSLAGSYQVTPDGSCKSLNHDQISAVGGPAMAEKREPRFVSKEKQLEKLRSRMRRKDVTGDFGA